MAYSPANSLPQSYVHAQPIASSSWTITHGLGRFPSLVVKDSANDQVYGDVTYTSPNTLLITFSAAFSGTAYLN